MRLFVLGNINSGKSHFIEQVQKILFDHKILKIDDWRIAHCDGSIEKEESLWKEFPKEIMKHENVIVELSGGGEVSKNIVNLLPENSFLVIKIVTDVYICLERCKKKNFSAIPYPHYPNAGTVEDTICSIDVQIKEGCIEKLWSKALAVLTVNSDTEAKILPILQYAKLFKAKQCLSELKSSLFLFGSAGRAAMSVNSDVDLYLLTKEPCEKIREILFKNFENVRIMANEFVVRENGILLEINHITDIEDCRIFYREAKITNSEKTILKDDFCVLDILKKYAAEKKDINETLRYTVERLDYYVKSLPSLIKKCDEYKFYFHSNIVVHEYVKLKAFLADNFDFSYLPLCAKDYLKENEWQEILYTFGNNQEKYIKRLEFLEKEIVSKVEKKYKIFFNL